LKNGLGIGRDIQAKVLNSLVDLEVIEVEYRGGGAARFIRVDIQAVKTLLSEAETA
jgi:hypothetical protein